MKNFSADSCVLRIPVLYGDEEFVGESAISSLIKNLQNQQPVKVSNFEIRYPSHVDDIAVVCCQLAKRKLKVHFKNRYSLECSIHLK